MVNPAQRRNASLLSVVMLGLIAWLLAACFQQTFVGPRHAAPVRKVSSAVRGFKEDFEAWRATLTAEEQALIQEQAQGEFNKAYRKSENFKKDLPEEKVAAFSKILGKFFENESEDYKKSQKVRPVDYEGLLKKAGDKQMDFSLKRCIVEVDRNADRRYNYAAKKIALDAHEGVEWKYPQSSPLVIPVFFRNNDTKSHQVLEDALKMMKDQKNDVDDEVKAMVEEWEKKGIPPVGEKLRIEVPEVLYNQLNALVEFMEVGADTLAKNNSQEFMDNYYKEEAPKVAESMVKWLTENYVSARDETEKQAKAIKDFYRSQAKRKDEGLTKADIAKEIWAEIPKYSSSDQPLPPLDDEVLAELAQIPAVQEGEFMHSWGTADVLYKSEAIDSFGTKYLLGVYETKEECDKAFDEWNKMYEDARSGLQAELSQWSKTEQARLDEEELDEGYTRIRKILEEAKGAK